ncbi:CBS domain-containing protein [Quadrisphaera granulorum]|uniref:CBS domain-containing protein n=1 Tax=Quadrisphaera granulorum TaxID=317664 RepID=A0A316ASI5_9ACTN|nr:putative nucleotidyltransferase substrate binding domain-containing protein [Quadrisphaera granulorum]PWJ53057.1 CBS domain-containing protein [Quadrisphaera granulorum]SZE97222.1 CBS domain-containing protein [Quadrisphaera granulorum]
MTQEATHTSSWAPGTATIGAPSYALVDDVLTRAPLVLAPSTGVAQAATAMTSAGLGCAAVPIGGGFAVLTDADIRAWVAVGCPSSADAASLARCAAPVVRLGTSATAALIGLLDADVEHVVVIDDDGALRGLISARDLVVSPTTSSASLHEQLRRASSVGELRRRAQRLPVVMRDATRRGLPASQVTAVHSSLLDTLVRRTIELVVARTADLDTSRFTWLALGSGGRREAVPSSDLDAAVVLDDGLSTDEVEAYRAAVADVVVELRSMGLASDEHGANPSHRLFSRTASQWRDGAREWLSDPSQAQGAVPSKGTVLVSLLVDGRPVVGDPEAPSVREAFHELRTHPAAMRLLLHQALVTRARLPSGWDVLRGRGGSFDVKAHALTPIVHLARWSALSAGSPALGTVDRLRATAGTVVLPQVEASTLVEIFELLQRLRLRHQLEQLDAGEAATDVVVIDKLSPIDRSVIRQAVREVAAVQRRAANLLAAAPAALAEIAP